MVPPARYANVVLLRETIDRRLSTSKPISPGLVFRLRLDIGALSRESQVEEPEPFPDHALPDEDLWIDVMLSSIHFVVAESRAELDHAWAAEGRFFLPRNGNPGRTPDEGRYLQFFLRAPDEHVSGARARVGYYFRGAVVQSQVLIADVGTGKGSFTIVTDYTIAASPVHLGAIKERPRLALLANDSSGNHQVSVRATGISGELVVPPRPLEIDKGALGKLIDDLRKALRSDDIAPTRRKRARDRLIWDLRTLAPLGWRLWSASAAQFIDAWDAVRKQPGNLVLHVARTSTSSFAFPWSFVYEHSLDSEILPERLEICPLVKDWDGHQPLVEGSPRECPHAGRIRHENLLCPFGFWGFRYAVEQLSSTDEPVTAIKLTAGARAVVATTLYDVDPEDIARHVHQLQAALPGVTLDQGDSKAKIRALLSTDLPLVYFFCHGEKVNAASPDTYLGVGKREKITADDFNGWVKLWREDGKRIWDKIRPLIFINACHSREINPDTLVSYLGAFVGTARAAGVIGTEVKVHQDLAMELATEFFGRFVRDGWSVERALREVRLDFLRDGNLFGLLYTPYCWADLTLVRIPVAGLDS